MPNTVHPGISHNSQAVINLPNCIAETVNKLRIYWRQFQTTTVGLKTMGRLINAIGRLQSTSHAIHIIIPSQRELSDHRFRNIIFGHPLYQFSNVFLCKTP